MAKKFKYPKKPKLDKCGKKPSKPKGGIKTEKQLINYEKKVAKYVTKCKELKKLNAKKMQEWEKECKAVDKAKNDFYNRVEKSKEALNGI